MRMEVLTSGAMAVAMIAAFLLIAGGARLIFRDDQRGRGLLMVAAAAVLIGNVLIWTL
jgi:high-affinity Fe2+/Pb2+ permease